MKTMMMLALSILSVVPLLAAPATPNQKPVQHVPARLDKVRLIQPAAEKKNHLLIVNVDHAIPEDVWPIVVTYAVSRLQLNVWTNSVKDFASAEYLRDPSALQKRFGDKAKVCLFLVNQSDGAPFIVA